MRDPEEIRSCGVFRFLCARHAQNHGGLQENMGARRPIAAAALQIESPSADMTFPGWRSTVLEVDSDMLFKYSSCRMDAETQLNYLVWGTDNIAYGPVELPVLVGWIKLGRVVAESWVFKEADGVWSRASELTELKVMFKSKLPLDPAATNNALGIHPGSLRRIKMLADIDERLLASLLGYLEVVRVPQFGTVVSKGEHGDALFMVLEGELRARVMIDGRETTLTTMGVGECFGELAVVDHEPRSADVVANQPSVLIKVSSGALKKMFAEAPALAAPFMFALTRVIAHRVRVLTKRFGDSIHFSRAASEVGT